MLPSPACNARTAQNMAIMLTHQKFKQKSIWCLPIFISHFKPRQNQGITFIFFLSTLCRNPLYLLHMCLHILLNVS